LEQTSKYPKSTFNDIIRRLTAFDIVTIAYIFFTFIYILIGIHTVPVPSFHLWIRLVILAGIFGIILLHNRYPGKITAFIRNFYPLALLVFWYTETFFLQGVIFGYIDPYLVRWESFLFGIQPSLTFSKLLPQLWFSELLYFGYFSFYLIIFLVCFIIYITNRSIYNEALYTLLFSFYIFYIVFAFVPSMGPHYWFNISWSEIPGGYFFSKAVRLAQDIGEKPTGAFPSSHVGISVLLLCLCYLYIRRWFWIFLPVVICLCAATVYIKAHYLIDVISGLICAPVLLWLSKFTFSRFPSKEFVPILKDSRLNKTD
jgi:membrane-associated phospholipid phosphatase